MNTEIRIAAGIVLYNPDDYGRLIKSIESVLKQVEKVYVYDNSTEEINISFQDRVTYLTEHQNQGMATALNKIMFRAKEDGYTWLITMDQDSILPDNMLGAFRKEINGDENIGIVCPQVVDSRRKYMEVIKDPEKEYVDFCITSASCTSIKVWEKIGGFDEWLFIDMVDNEFCKRLTLSGYKILRLNNFVLDQEFGKIIPKKEKTQQFWIRLSKKLHNENIAKFSYKKYVSPMRVYYTCRNIIYVNKKLKKYGKTAYENYNCKGYLGFVISFAVPSFLRAQSRLKVLKSIIKGTIDGLKVKVELWEMPEEIV